MATILIVNGTSRPNYLALAQPPLLAPGGVAFEGLAARRQLCALPSAAIAVLLATGLLGAPLALPLLPPAELVAWQRTLGIEAPVQEKGEESPLDSHFADMFGWPGLVRAVADAWHEIPPARRVRAAVLAYDYSSAAAIDHLGPALGLPGAISGHNSYWLWGPEGASGELLLVVGGRAEDLQPWYEVVRPVGRVDCHWCRAERDERTLWRAEGLRRPFSQLWDALRSYH